MCILYGQLLMNIYVLNASCHVESLPHHSNGFTILYHCRKHHSDTSYIVRNIHTCICRVWMSEEILCLVQLYICCCRKWQGVSEEELCIEKDILPQNEWKHNPTSLLWMLGICPVFFHCVCISLITRVIKNLYQHYVNSNWAPSPKSEVFPLVLHRCALSKAVISQNHRLYTGNDTWRSPNPILCSKQG